MLIYPLSPAGWAGLVVAALVLAINPLVTQLRMATRSTYLQNTAPGEVRAHVIAVSRLIGDLGTPFGALLGGALGTALGLRPAALVGMAGVWAASLVLVFSPLRGAKTLQDAERNSDKYARALVRKREARASAKVRKRLARAFTEVGRGGQGVWSFTGPAGELLVDPDLPKKLAGDPESEEALRDDPASRERLVTWWLSAGRRPVLEVDRLRVYSATADGQHVLLVRSDAELLFVLPTGERVREAHQAWAAMVAGLPRYPNTREPDWPTHQWQAERARVAPARLGTDALPEDEVLAWVLRPDGTGWFVPVDVRNHPDIRHTVAAGGGEILAGGEIQLGRIVGTPVATRFNVRTRYHAGNGPHQNRLVYAVGRALLALHGITVAPDAVGGHFQRRWLGQAGFAQLGVLLAVAAAGPALAVLTALPSHAAVAGAVAAALAAGVLAAMRWLRGEKRPTAARFLAGAVLLPLAWVRPHWALGAGLAAAIAWVWRTLISPPAGPPGSGREHALPLVARLVRRGLAMLGRGARTGGRGHDHPLAWYLDDGQELAVRWVLPTVRRVRSVRQDEYGWSTARGPPPVVEMVSAAHLAELIDGDGAQIAANLIAYTLRDVIYVLDAAWYGLNDAQRKLVIDHEVDPGADHDVHARRTLERLITLADRRPGIGELLPHSAAEIQARAGQLGVAFVAYLATRTYGGLRLRDASRGEYAGPAYLALPVRMEVLDGDTAGGAGVLGRAPSLAPDGDTAGGRVVGAVSVQFERQAHGVLRLDLTNWHLDRSAQGNGFGGALLWTLEDWLADSGGGVMGVRGSGAGRYFFATHGFEWLPGAEHQAKAALRQLMAEKHLVDAEAKIQPDPRLARESTAAEDVLRRARTHRFGEPGYPTPREIAMAGWPGELGAGVSWIGKRAMRTTAAGVDTYFQGEKRVPAHSSPPSPLRGGGRGSLRAHAGLGLAAVFGLGHWSGFGLVPDGRFGALLVAVSAGGVLIVRRLLTDYLARRARGPPLAQERRWLGRIAKALVFVGVAAVWLVAPFVSPAAADARPPAQAAAVVVERAQAPPGGQDMDRAALARRVRAVITRANQLDLRIDSLGYLDLESRASALKLRAEDFSDDADSRRISAAAQRIVDRTVSPLPEDLYPSSLSYMLGLIDDPSNDAAGLALEVRRLERSLGEASTSVDRYAGEEPTVRAELERLEDEQQGRETRRRVIVWALVLGAPGAIAGLWWGAQYRSVKRREAEDRLLRLSWKVAELPDDAAGSMARGSLGEAATELDQLAAALEKLAGFADPRRGSLDVPASLEKGRADLARLLRLHAVLAEATGEAAVSEEFWRRAWQVLAETDRPGERRELGERLFLALAGAVDRTDTETGQWHFLRSSGRVNELFAVAGSPSVPAWLTEYWSSATVAQRLRFAVEFYREAIDLRAVGLRIDALQSTGRYHFETFKRYTNSLREITGRAHSSAAVAGAVQLLAARAGTRLVEAWETHSIAHDPSLTKGPTPELWMRAWMVLSTVLEAPFAEKPALHRDLLRKLIAAAPVPMNLGDLDDAGHRAAVQELLSALDSAWLADALARARMSHGPEWLYDRAWERLSARNRLTLALLVAVSGNADWVAELPKRRRTEHQLLGLIMLFTEPHMDPYRESLLGLLAELPGRESRSDRAQFLGAWTTLVSAMEWTVPVIELDPTEASARSRNRWVTAVLNRPRPQELAVPELLERVRAQLAARPPPDRPGVMERTAVELERRARAAAEASLGARLDPGLPLRLEIGSEEFNALVRYLPVSHATYRKLMGRWLEEWQRTGDRAAAAAVWDAAWREWLPAASRQVIARVEAPDEMTWRDPDGQEFTVGVSRDPIEIMHLGHGSSSCLCLVKGGRRDDTQAHLLHPRIAVVYVRNHVANEPDLRVVRITVFVTDKGIIPTSRLYKWGKGEFTDAFATYLKAWADHTGRPLLASTNEKMPKILDGQSETVELTLDFPTPGVPAHKIWLDLTWQTFTMPTKVTWNLRRYTPHTQAPTDTDGAPAETGTETEATPVAAPRRGPLARIRAALAVSIWVRRVVLAAVTTFASWLVVVPAAADPGGVTGALGVPGWSLVASGALFGVSAVLAGLAWVINRRGPPPAEPAPGTSAAIFQGFLPGEESALRTVLQQAWHEDLARPVDPDRLPGAPHDPPGTVVLIPGEYLRQRGLSRLADRLGAYTLWIDGNPVLVVTEEILAVRSRHQPDRIRPGEVVWVRQAAPTKPGRRGDHGAARPGVLVALAVVPVLGGLLAQAPVLGAAAAALAVVAFAVVRAVRRHGAAPDHVGRVTMRGKGGGRIGRGSAVWIGNGMAISAAHVVRGWPADSFFVDGKPVLGMVMLRPGQFGSPDDVALARHAVAHARLEVGLGEVVDLVLLITTAGPAKSRSAARPAPRIGESLTVTGFPWGRLTTRRGPVVRVRDGHYRVAAYLGPGASGGPALDGDDGIGGIVSFSNAGAGSTTVVAAPVVAGFAVSALRHFFNLPSLIRVLFGEEAQDNGLSLTWIQASLAHLHGVSLSLPAVRRLIRGMEGFTVEGPDAVRRGGTVAPSAETVSVRDLRRAVAWARLRQLVRRPAVVAVGRVAAGRVAAGSVVALPAWAWPLKVVAVAGFALVSGGALAWLKGGGGARSPPVDIDALLGRARKKLVAKRFGPADKLLNEVRSAGVGRMTEQRLRRFTATHRARLLMVYRPRGQLSLSAWWRLAWPLLGELAKTPAAHRDALDDLLLNRMRHNLEHGDFDAGPYWDFLAAADWVHLGQGARWAERTVRERLALGLWQATTGPGVPAIPVADRATLLGLVGLWLRDRRVPEYMPVWPRDGETAALRALLSAAADELVKGRTKHAARLLAVVQVGMRRVEQPDEELDRLLTAVSYAVEAAAADARTTRPGQYLPSWGAVLLTFGFSMLAKMLAIKPGLRRSLPEPFDLFSHAGNLGGGWAVGMLAVFVGYFVLRTGRGYLTGDRLHAFRARWVPGVLLFTAAINAFTEVRWMVENVGVAHALFGPHTVADPLDLVYSVAIAGLVAAFSWREQDVRGAGEPANGVLLAGALDRRQLARFEAVLPGLVRHATVRPARDGQWPVLEIPRNRAVRAQLRDAGLKDVAVPPLTYHWADRGQLVKIVAPRVARRAGGLTQRAARWVGRLAKRAPGARARGGKWVRVPRMRVLGLASERLLGVTLAAGVLAGVTLNVLGAGWVPVALGFTAALASILVPAWRAEPVEGRPGYGWARLFGWLGYQLWITLPTLVYGVGSGMWVGGVLGWLVRGIAWRWGNLTRNPLVFPSGAKVIRVPVVDPVWLTRPGVLAGAAAFAGVAVLVAVGYGVRLLVRRPGTGYGARSGAIAVELPAGRPVAQIPDEHAAAKTAVAELLAELRPAPLVPGHPDHRLADPEGRWAAHHVPFYVLPGLNRRYASRVARRTALIMFVAPEPDGAPAVFIDPLTLARLHRLDSWERALLAERELARIRQPELPEQAIQALPMPEPARLRLLVGNPNPGVRRARASDDLATAVELAASVADHLANASGRTMRVERLLDRIAGDIHDLEAAVGLHPWLHIDDVAARLLPLTPPVTPAVAPIVSPVTRPPAEPAGGPAAITVVPAFGRAHLEPVTERDGAGARIHQAIELYLEMLDEAGLPLDPAVRERFVGLLEHIRDHTFWDRNGGSTAIELDAHLRVPVMWLAPEDLAVKATNLAEVAALLGFRLDAELMGAFAVVWHELGHVLQLAYGWDAGATDDPFDTLARHSLAAGLSGPLLVEPNPFTTVLEVESERLAEGLASLLLVHYLTTRFELTRLQSHYLPTVLRSVMADGFWRKSSRGAPIAEAPELPGYLHYHEESAVRAVLSRAAAAAHGGGLVRGGLSHTQRRVLERWVLPTAIEQGHTRLVEVEGSPPLRVLDEAGMRPLLERVGLGELPSNMLDYAWTHPVHAPGGEMVMFADTAATVLANPALLRWLQRHNRTFHLGDHPDPHGAEHEADAAAILEEWDRIRAGQPAKQRLFGEFAVRELTALRAEAIAEEWFARLQQTDKPQVFRAEARELRLLVVIARMLLRGQALDESWPVGPVRFYLASDERFSTPGVDPVRTSDVVPTQAGTRHIYAADPLGLLYRVVAELGRARGETSDHAMWHAELALRLVDQRELAGLPGRIRPDRADWTSAGYAHTLARMARTDPQRRRHRVIAADERVTRVERETEPGWWQRLHLHHAGLRWFLAVRAARSVRVDEDALRREHAAAVAELRGLIDGLPGLTGAQRQMLDRAVAGRSTEPVGGFRVSHALRVLRTEAEFDHLRFPDKDLFELVVRNIVWGDLLSGEQLPGLAELRAEATGALVQGAPKALRMLLVDRSEPHGRLVEPQPPSHSGGNRRTVHEEYRAARAALRELAEANGLALTGPGEPSADLPSRVALNLWALRMAGARTSSADLLPLVVRNIVWGELTATHPALRLLAIGSFTSEAEALTALLADPAEGNDDLFAFQPPSEGDPPVEIRLVATEPAPDLDEPTAGPRASLNAEGISVLIGPEGVSLGRTGGAPTSVALGDPSLADPHASITLEADRWMLTAHADTTVGGEPVTEATPLADGNRLRLGDVELVFRDRPRQRLAHTGLALAGLAWFGGLTHVDWLSSPALLGGTVVAVTWAALHLTWRGRRSVDEEPPSIPADASPAMVFDRWRTLSRPQRSAWIRKSPDEAGRRAGIPVVDRHRANLLVLAREKAALKRELRELWGMTAYVVPRREAIRGMLKGIKAIERSLGLGFIGFILKPFPRAYLIGFDTIGRGHAIVAYENPDTSAYVALYVPGMGNRLETVGDGLRSAKRLWKRIAFKLKVRSVSVIAHWALDQPQHLREATSTRYAEAAAPKLHRFLLGIRATGRADQQLTLIAHSYGSVISGITAALRDVLRLVDDWIILGSPGVHAAHISKLLRGLLTRVWVASAKRDPLGRTPERIHGVDPASQAFGALVFDAGTGGRYGGQFGVERPHRSYWNRHSPALANMALIITGRRDQVRLVAGRGVRTWWGPKRRYRIREMGRHDGPALDQVFEGISSDSKYTPYFGGMPRLTAEMRRHLLDIDGRRHVALVAEARTKSGWRAIGIVRFIGIEENRADIAAEIVDEWQGRGVATQMLRILGERAAVLGYTDLVGEFLPTNRAIRRVLLRVFPDVEFGYDGYHPQVRIPLGPRLEPRGWRRWPGRFASSFRIAESRQGLHLGVPLLGLASWGSVPHHIEAFGLVAVAAGMLLLARWGIPRGRGPPVRAAVRIAVLVALTILMTRALGEVAAQLAVVLPMFGPRRPDGEHGQDGDAAVPATRPTRSRRSAAVLSRDEARAAYALYTGAETGQPMSVDLVALAIGIPAEMVWRSFLAHGLALRDYRSAAAQMWRPSQAERMSTRPDPRATEAFEPGVIEARLRELAAALGHTPTRAEWHRAGLAPSDTTVIRYYGSWNKAQTAAGLSNFRATYTDEQVLSALAEAAAWVVAAATSAGVPSPPITLTRYKEWAAQRPAGSPPAPSAAAVAKRFGGFGNAVRRLAETGTRKAATPPTTERPAPRPVTKPLPESAAQLTPEQAVIWELYWDGLFSGEEIATLLGTTPWQVRKVFRDVGQPRRTRREVRQLLSMVERAVTDLEAGRIVALFRGTTDRPAMTPTQVAEYLGEDLRKIYAALRPVVGDEESRRRWASPDKPLAHAGFALAGLAWLGHWPSHVMVPVITGAAVLGLLGYAVRRIRGPPAWRRVFSGLIGVLLGAVMFSSALVGRADAVPDQMPAQRSVAVERSAAKAPTTAGAQTTAVPSSAGASPTAVPSPRFHLGIAPKRTTAGREAAAYGVTFAEFNAANGGRFTGPHQRIGGQRVKVPATWKGIITAQPGDSLWWVFKRQRDWAGYRAAVRADPTPDLIYPGQRYRISNYRPIKPVKPVQPVKPVHPVKPVEPPVDLPALEIRPVPWSYPAGLAGAITLALAAWLGTALRLRPRTSPKHRAPPKQLPPVKQSTKQSARHSAPRKHSVSAREVLRWLAAQARAGRSALRDQLTIWWAGARVAVAWWPGVRVEVAELRGLPRRVVELIGWDMPVRAGPRRTTRARLAAGLLGFGVALAAGGFWPAAVGALVGGAVLAVRVRWSANWLPTPRPADGLRTKRPFRALGHTAVGLFGALAGELSTHAPALIKDALRWIASKPESTLAVKTLISALAVSAVINYRSVKNRRTLLYERGIYTRPRRDAWHSAVRAAAVAWVSDLLALAGLPVLVFWVGDRLGVGHNLAAMIPAVLAAALGSAVQLRQRGGERSWNAVAAGLYAIPTFQLLNALGIRGPPTSWGDYFHDLALWLALVAPTPFITDYLIAAGGALLLKRVQWLQYRTGQNTLTRAAGIGTVRRWHIWLQRSGDRLKSSLELFGRPDWLVTLLRVDAALKVVLGYSILRAKTTMEVVAFAALALAGGLLLWPLRDLLERKQKALGSKSSRSMARRERPIGPLYRVTRRVDALPGALDDFLAATGLSTGEWQLDDPELPRRTAARMVELLGQLPPNPLELDLVDQYVPELTDATARVREQWLDRHGQHLRALALTVLMVASNRDALFGALTRMSERHQDRADILAFLDRLLDELVRPENLNQLALDADDRILLGLPADRNAPLDGVVIRPIPRRVWEERLGDAMAERHRQHLHYLLRDLWDLLLTAGLRLAGSPRGELARRAIEALTTRALGQLERERHRKRHDQGMVVARALLGERIRALRNALVADERRIDEPLRPSGSKDIAHRIEQFQRLKAALTLLDSTFAVLDEVELHTRERDKWRQNIERAARAKPKLEPGSLLAALLIVAGAKGPVTAADLVRRHAGLAYPVTERTWQRKLHALARAGLLEGTPGEGYRAVEGLRVAWRRANPMLRHALRTNPRMLPGGEKLAPLLKAGASEDDIGHAHQILLDLLSHGTRVYRYHTPGMLDDLMRAVLPGWSWWRGALYQRRHPLARVERLAPEPRTRPERELRASIRRATSRELTRAWRRAELAVIKLHRARRHTAQPNAPPHGRADLRAAADSPELRAAYQALNEAIDNRLAAYEDLRALAERIRTVDEPEPGARSARLGRLLVRADRLVDYGPSRTQEAPPPAYELRRAYAALKAANRRLGRTRPGTTARLDALQQARVALDRFFYATREAVSADLGVEWAPRQLLLRGLRLAPRLVKAGSNALTHISTLTTPTVGGERGSIAGVETAEATFALSTAGTPRLAVASLTGPVPGARNTDAVAAHVDPASGVVTVVVADGLGSVANAALAARVAVETALEELVRTDSPRRTREQAHLAAAARAGARVAALALPGQAYQPAATYLAVQVVPAAGESHLAEVITSNLGDTAAHLVPAARGWSRLSVDHTNLATEGLVAFLGENPRVRPSFDRILVTDPGNLVLATRGLAEQDLGGLAPDRTDEVLVREIARRSLERSGLGNLTLVDIPLVFGNGGS
ncbi:hypothetical protein GCM10023321_70070 [Pseudonocardia eucalypti]|uniref:N-acetyltransferase domain-containing protein n=1 Tax=Pseudonocardia eucalypti TaxID=648755 RepID=A0ABP9R4K5_9PSEU